MLALFSPIFTGLLLGVSSFTQYAMQREILRGDNRNAAFMTGLLQGVMGSALITTLSTIFPAFALMRGFSLISWGTFLLPITAGLCAGGYQQLKESWLNSQNTYLIGFINRIDAALDFFPKRLRGFTARVLSRCHSWFGTVFLSAQIAAFAAAAAIMPPLGIAGLSYIALFYARGKNWLPGFLARPMEKINYYVNLSGGLFLNNIALKAWSGLVISKEFIIYVIFPRLMRRYLGESSEFLQAADLTQVTKPEPKVARNITVKNIKALLSILPDLSHGGSGQQNTQRFDIEALINEFASGNLQARFENELNAIGGPILQPAANSLQTLEQNFPQYPSAGILARLKYFGQAAVFYPRYAFAWVRFMVVASRATVVTANSFLNGIEATSETGLATTVRHMADTPNTLPMAPNVDVEVLKSLVANSGLETESAQNVIRANCLNSAKFQRKLEKYDVIRYGRLIELQTEKQKLETEIYQLGQETAGLGAGSIFDNPMVTPAALEAEIQQRRSRVALIHEEVQAINEHIIHAWRQELSLPADSTAARVFSTYIQKNFTAVLNRLVTGQDMFWDKSVESFALVRNKGMHIFAHLHKLLSSTTTADRREAHDIIIRLAVEAGDFCGNGVYDVISDIFEQYILPQLNLEEANFTAVEDMALFLQQERQEMVDSCINYMKDDPRIKSLFPTLDFTDRHVYSQLISLLRVFNLKAKQNAQSDLSNNKIDFITQMQYNMYAYFAIRLLTLLDQGYSPKGILWRLQQYENAVAGSFNTRAVCSKWAAEFTSAESKNYISTLLAAEYGTTADEQAVEKRGRALVYTLMLFDMGVLKASRPDLAAKIEQILQNPAQDVAYDVDTGEFELPDVPIIVDTQAYSRSLAARRNTMTTMFNTLTTSTTPATQQAPTATTAQARHAPRTASFAAQPNRCVIA